MSDTFPLAKKIGIVQPAANIDYRYGPWPTVQRALEVTAGLRQLGLTVAISSVSTGAIEYHFKNGIADIDLIVKSVDLSGYLPLSGGSLTGNISTNNIIYAKTGDSDLWNSGYVTYNTNSGLDLAARTYVNSNSANINNVLTRVNTTSANWNSVYSSWNSNSALDLAARTFVNSNSSNINNVLSRVNSTSANWNSVYSTYNTNSALYATQQYTANNFLALSGGYVSGDVSIGGNLFLLGTATQISTEDLILTNSLIFLASGNPSDTVDIGFVGYTSGSQFGQRFTGLIRDSFDKKWYLFSQLSSLSGSDVNINSPSLQIDTLRANIEGNLVANTNVFGNLSASGNVFGENLKIQNWNTAFDYATVYSNNSSKYESVYSNVNLVSGNLNSVYSSWNLNSASVVAAETFVENNSSNIVNVNTKVNNTSANWDSVYSSWNLNSADLIDVENFVRITSANNSVFSTVCALSANWNSVYSLVNNNSTGWENTESILNTNLENWNSVYSTVNSTSSNYESNYSSYQNASANYESVYSSWNTNSASVVEAETFVESISANINNVLTKVNTTSANWDSVYSAWNNVSGLDLNVRTYVNSNSANINNVLTRVNTTSANWNSVYSSWNNTSGLELNVRTYVNSNSSNINNVLSRVNTTSANWNSVYSAWNNVSGLDLNVRTYVNSNSANINSVTSKVNTTSANWDSVYSTWNINSASLISAETFVENNSANISSVTSKVNNTSGNWDSVYSAWNSVSGLDLNVRTYVNSNSSNINNVTTWVNNNSSNSASQLNNLSGKWESTFATVCTLSSNWGLGFNYGSVFANNSSSYVSRNFVESSFIPISTIDTQLNINSTNVVQNSAVAKKIQDIESSLNILVPPPSYAQPSATLTNLTSQVEIGTTVNQNITLNWNQGNAGAAQYFRLLRNSIQVQQQSSSWTYNVNEVATANTTTFTNVVSYAQGPILNNALGLPDDRGRIATGSKSVNSSFTGYYRIFYGAIDVLPASLRNLPKNNHFVTTNAGTTVTMNASEFGTIDKNIIAIAMPSNRSLLEVITNANETITGNFTLSSVFIPDAAGTSVSYKLYRNTTIVPLNIPLLSVKYI